MIKCWYYIFIRHIFIAVGGLIAKTAITVSNMSIAYQNGICFNSKYSLKYKIPLWINPIELKKRENSMTTKKQQAFTSKLPPVNEPIPFDFDGLTERQKDYFYVLHMMLAQINRQYINIGGKVLDRKVAEQLERAGKLPQ